MARNKMGVGTAWAKALLGMGNKERRARLRAIRARVDAWGRALEARREMLLSPFLDEIRMLEETCPHDKVVEPRMKRGKIRRRCKTCGRSMLGLVRGEDGKWGKRAGDGVSSEGEP